MKNFLILSFLPMIKKYITNNIICKKSLVFYINNHTDNDNARPFFKEVYWSQLVLLFFFSRIYFEILIIYLVNFKYLLL